MNAMRFPLFCLLYSLLLAAWLPTLGCKKAPPPEPDYTVLEQTNAPAAPAAQNLVRYDAKPGSSVRIEGTSTLHDWQVVGKIIGGYLELPDSLTQSNAVVQAGKAPAHAEAFIPVRSMRSITKEGNAYSTAMDDIMYDKLLAAEHPRIQFFLKEVEITAPAEAPASSLNLNARGDLVVAGVTNNVAFPAVIKRLPDDKLTVSGKVSTKMTAFNIQPPAPGGMLIKTGDDVQLSFEWSLARRSPNSQ